MIKHNDTQQSAHKHVSRAQAAQEAAAISTRGATRSRWIATLVIMVVLGLGGWVIAQRVMPYAFDDAATATASGDVMDSNVIRDGVALTDMGVKEGAAFVPREDLQPTAALAAPTPRMAARSSEAPSTPERKTRKTGRLAIVVDSVAWTVEHAGEIARRYGGEVMQVNLYADEKNRMRGTISLRVAAKDFDAAFDALKKEVAKVVEHESVDTQDVTEAYVDLEARLTNKRAEEQAFAAILERATKTDDIIKVTRELARVRGEIERLEGQLRFMRSRTDYAAITLSLREDEKVVTPDTGWRPGAVARQSLNHLIANVQHFIDNAIRFATVFVPTFLLYVLVIVILWKVGKRVVYGMVTRYERRRNRAETK